MKKVLDIQSGRRGDIGEEIKISQFMDVMDMPKLEFIIGDMLPREGLSLVYGKTSSFKTFAALDMTLSVAAGIEFMGLETKQEKVLYICSEGQGGINARLKASCMQHQIAPESLQGRMYFITQSVPVDNAEALTKLKDAIGKMEHKPGLIVLDTLNRCMEGDENSARDVGRLTRHCEDLRDTFHAAVMLVHHTGHQHKRYRGSSAIGAALDSEIEVTRSKVPAPMKLHAECKSRSRS